MINAEEAIAFWFKLGKLDKVDVKSRMLMQGTEKEYMEARQQRSKTLRRIMSLVGLISFGSAALFGIANMFKSALQEPQPLETATVVSVEEQLQKRARGYESVLEREPENVTALEGLVKVRLEMGDKKGAIAPLEKLVGLYPHKDDYKVVLEQLKLEVD
ncbi:MAG: tetratricopeptide repeat protein [Trichodesmium sp. St16_bin4-tuft]|nr:tetratricopeptide repeat protein [Trichodesmium sp. St5_bin8]MDE5078141.1 tetratricopeptide repeat protein [Trichodesmium sp. St2_bin6]MDE5091941.1 tetratricopeptide repeat protein [Trichodesmium sp. St18_bin3_1_1]MDE5097161.1 tetratricopeptide repeat protein [Trichodesmium sp. St16_bin4-tuft]MDE5104758.1 tetratricopeptide repeat protein [Trichodesmium sp. St19_bin2]